MRIKISAIEKYLPVNKVTSRDLERGLNISNGRIEKLTGVGTRHYAAPKETVCDMASVALKKALNKAHLRPSDLDLLLFAGASFDYPIPCNAAIIKSKITDDSDDFPCFDIDSTCLSFINGLDICHLYLQSGRYNRIAIVSSEISSIALSPKNEKTYGLFGDAAVAMIIENTSADGYEPTYTNFSNYPSGVMLAHLPIGGAVNSGKHEPPDSDGYYFQMEGKKLIRLTLSHLDDFIKKMEKRTDLKLGSFDYIIAHQTSRYGNEYFMKNYRLNPEKVVNTLNDYGNCVSASIPLGLERAYNDPQNSFGNKNLLIIGSAAGLSFGGMVLHFS